MVRFRAQGKPKDALPVYQQALDIYEKVRDPRHPEISQPLIGMGEAYLALNQASAAIIALERALSILNTKNYDPRWLAQGSFALAQAIRRANHDTKRAQELARFSREIYLRAESPHEREVATIDLWLSQNH